MRSEIEKKLSEKDLLREYNDDYCSWLQEQKFPSESEHCAKHYLKRWLQDMGYSGFKLKFETCQKRQPPDFWLTLANGKNYAVEVTELHSAKFKDHWMKVVRNKTVRNWEKEFREEGYTGKYWIVVGSEETRRRPMRLLRENLEKYLKFTADCHYTPTMILGYLNPKWKILKVEKKEDFALLAVPLQWGGKGYGDLREQLRRSLSSKAENFEKNEIPREKRILVFLNCHPRGDYAPNWDHFMKEENLNMDDFHSVFLSSLIHPPSSHNSVRIEGNYIFALQNGFPRAKERD